MGDDPYFCCTGCAVVAQALQEAGFSKAFYRLRDLAPEGEGARPAQVAADMLHHAELDTAAFLEQHTDALSHGVRSVELFLDGVHCAACVWLVERLPFEIAGVSKARLNLPRARLTLHFDPEKVRLSEVAQWLAQFGYVVYPTRRQGMARRTEAERRLLIKMGICWALAGNVMLFAFTLYSGLDATSDATLVVGARWASLALATASVLYGGSEFIRRAWASLKLAARTRQLRALHIDTPISLGILVGFGHSAWATISGQGEVWFDSIAVLIAALLTARWLQLRSRRLAGDASERLLSLIPSMARKVVGDKREVVRVEELQKDDVVEVPAGEVFPVDGVVVSGVSTINNAVLTGESRPEPVDAGTPVEAGATNLSAPVQVRVRTTGEQTRVGRLLAWIQTQEANDAPVVLLADRLSSYFVMGVLALAAVTALGWLFFAPEQVVPHVVALLVISCPCALGMATPLAMAIATGRAARAGIFIKSDEATQQLTSVDTVVLDKTGTLTEGRMTLVEYDGSEAAVDLAAALETHSNHPIASALVQARLVCNLDGQPADAPHVASFESIAGSGLRGWVSEHDVAVGRPGWIREMTAPPASPFEEALHAYARKGYTPVAVAVDGQWAAVLAFGDRIRAESKTIIRGLQAQGKAVYLLSGDHAEVVRAVADSLGLEASHAFGSISPEEKQAFVARLREERRTVVMIGDGVNDAAALQMADVGIAVHGGSTPSLVAADVFLTRDGLQPFAEVMAGAKRVMQVVRRNLGLSLVYNVVGAGAAMLGLVTPFVAAVAMPISSLVVVASSMLQRSFSTPPRLPVLKQSTRATAPELSARAT